MPRPTVRRRGGRATTWRLGLVRRVASAAVVLAALVATVFGGDGRLAWAEPPPTPLPWARVYLPDDPVPDLQIVYEMFKACEDTYYGAFAENDSLGPRIAVLGESGENQTRSYALADPAFHWIYDTHCGEKFGSAIDDGRVGHVLAAHPDVLVVALGNNDLTNDFRFHPEQVGAAIDELHRLLDATDSVPCRVIVNMVDGVPANLPPEIVGPWHSAVTQLNTAYRASEVRSGVHVADWNARVSDFWPWFTDDTFHLTHAGINARINLTLATARQCQVPDSPVGLGAAASFGSADLWWDELPGPERVTDYRVELSDGRSFVTSQTSLSVTGLGNGLPQQFRVSARNGAGLGEPSRWSAPFVSRAEGARFHALAPQRVLDTRYGTGGKSTPFGPGETVRVDLTGAVPADASAVVVNLTATGQTAPTFLTAWPGDRPRPLASNLNPRPGVAAVPAMATMPLAADRSIEVFNNSGQVNVVADVVGYYGPSGAAAGALYHALPPSRLLDTRLATGAKTSPFGAGEALALPITSVPADASGVVVNVTSTNTTAPGFVTMWPEGLVRPLASNLNPQPGLTRANLTVVRLGSDQSIAVFNNSASTDLVIDLVGYYTADGAPHGGSEYFPLTPTRAYDTRDGTGGIVGPVATTTNVSFTFTGRGLVPVSGVTAVDANLTVTEPTAGGHTTAWPTGIRPTASNLNYESREAIANRDFLMLDGGSALAWSTSPSIHYVIDVNGWFGPTL